MKVKSFIRNIITICLIIVICICGYKIYSKLYEYKKADNIYNDLRKEKNYTNKNSSYAFLPDLNHHRIHRLLSEFFLRNLPLQNPHISPEVL